MGAGEDSTTDAVSLATESCSVHAGFSDFPAVRPSEQSIICVKNCQEYLYLQSSNCGILIPDLISPGVKLSEKRIFISGSFATGNSGITRLYRRLLVPHRRCWETWFRGIASHLDSLFPPKGETRKTGYPNLIPGIQSIPARCRLLSAPTEYFGDNLNHKENQ